MSTSDPTFGDYIAKSTFLSYLPDIVNTYVTKPILGVARSVTSNPDSVFYDQTAFQVEQSNAHFNPALEIMNSMLSSSNENPLAFKPDISGYVFVLMMPPDLSGITDKGVVQNMIRLCKSTCFYALDFTPPAITINTEAINTQASISMPYATTKIATGEMSVSFLDDQSMNINAMHNLWIEYLYNQLWGDFPPAAKYMTPGDPAFGALDYATTMYIVKYSANIEEQQVPTMVGKATGIFPLGLPTKETIGVRTSNDLVIETVNYTCSYYEVVHPRADLQTYSSTPDGKTILDEAYDLLKSMDDRPAQYYNPARK